MALKFIQPQWDAPDNIKAFSTTRAGGYSEAPWDSLNVALHVGDQDAKVISNRRLLCENSGLPNPRWLTQTHSTNVIEHCTGLTDADGCFTSEPNKSCIIMTADCLPVLLCNGDGSWVAAIHAGWRGLADGILTKSLEAYDQSSGLAAWIGPAISQQYFEVGDDVRHQFTIKNNTLSQYFHLNPNGKWMCDLVGIAKQELESLGVNVFLSDSCTYDNERDFFSHRRASHEQGMEATTGRMASVIWIEPQQ